MSADKIKLIHDRFRGQVFDTDSEESSECIE